MTEPKPLGVDYPIDLDGEYRDYAFVKAALEEMVDEVTKNDNPHPPQPQICFPEGF